MRVVVNAAMSIDGKLASATRDQLKLSGSEDTARVHDLRAQSDAILVGIETVLHDNPKLTARPTTGTDELPHDQQPIRVVADSHARTPADAAVLDDAADSIILVSDNAPTNRVTALSDAGASIVTAGIDRVDLEASLDTLHEQGVTSLLVEGGGELIFSILETGRVTELTVYIAPIIIGGRDAPTLADGDGILTEFPTFTVSDVTRLDTGVVLRFIPEFT